MSLWVDLTEREAETRVRAEATTKGAAVATMEANLRLERMAGAEATVVQTETVPVVAKTVDKTVGNVGTVTVLKRKPGDANEGGKEGGGCEIDRFVLAPGAGFSVCNVRSRMRSNPDRTRLPTQHQQTNRGASALTQLCVFCFLITARVDDDRTRRLAETWSY